MCCVIIIIIITIIIIIINNNNNNNNNNNRRAGIERELASRADQRVYVSRWFGHVERMDECCMYGQKGVDGRSKWRVGTRETEVRLDGLCEGGLGQQKNVGGG